VETERVLSEESQEQVKACVNECPSGSSFLFNMMPICGGVAVKSHLEQKITVSFGCVDSRNFAGLKSYTVAVGIPRNLCNVIVS